MPESDITYEPGRVIAGRYRIVAPLSQGGMGAVYLAQQISLGRDVALKVMLERSGADPELTRRFDIEARAVCQLKHPNIITYHDYGRDEAGQPFLVMEYLSGYSGTKLIYGERRPALQDLVHVVAQVCSALHEAHGKGIIHRDLKWSNVMVCPQARDPYFAKLIDFGIMKVATDGSSGDQRALTRTGMLLGTPEYMSPEAICGMPIDGRADQYSLAIMVWEALEGHRPFDAPSHFELLRQQVQDEAPPLAVAGELAERYPQLEATILKAMEKHPDDRFEDILGFQQALLASIGLADATTAPARPAARASRPAGTPLMGGPPRASLPNGMPVSRTRLPAAPLTGPRPVDTHVKTGPREADDVRPRRLHWGVLTAGFVALIALGFFGVWALLGPKEPEAAARDGQLAAAATTAPTTRAEAEPPRTTDASEGERMGVGERVDAGERVGSGVDTSVSAGARPEKVEPDKDKVETEKVEPEKVEPEKVEPEKVEPEKVEPEKVEPEKVEPEKVEPEKVEPEKVEPEKVTPKPAAPGRVFVQVDPWGNLAIDGRPVGRAPFEGELKPGTHTVTVTNTFFKGAYTFRIKVESGKRATRTVVLADHLDKIE